MDDPNQIVVTGRSTGALSFNLFTIGISQYALESDRMSGKPYKTANNVFPTNTTADQISVTVNATLDSDPTKSAQIKEAAINVAVALAKIASFLQKLNPTTQAHWDGKYTTVGQILTDLHQTKFVVGDFSGQINNQGVGNAATRHPGLTRINLIIDRFREQAATPIQITRGVREWWGLCSTSSVT